MTKKDLLRKLTSRKFWAAIAEFVTMLIIFFHGTEAVAAQVAAIIMAGAAVIAYIVGEGLADAACASANGNTAYYGEPYEPDPPSFPDENQKVTVGYARQEEMELTDDLK